MKLFRAMGEIRGVQDVGPVTDIVGEEILAVAWRPPFEKRKNISMPGVIYFAVDPSNSMFRGTLGYRRPDPKPAEMALEAEIVLAAGFVDEPGQTP